MSTTLQQSELLPCPFCGCMPSKFAMPRDENIPHDWVAVQCCNAECPAAPVVSGGDAEEATRRWNWRWNWRKDGGAA